MKIGLLIGGIPPDRSGGAEQQILQLADELGRRGHPVVLFARSYKPRPRYEGRGSFLIARRPVLGMPRIRLALDVLLAARDLAHWHDQLDIVLAYQTVANGLIAALAGPPLGLPTVVSIRGNREYREHGPLPGLVYRRATAILTQSQLVRHDLLVYLRAIGRESLADHVARKAYVWPNGVRLPEAVPTVGSGIVYVGRLVKDKGVFNLIEAVARVQGARLTIIGDGPERQALQARAAALRHPIHFTGWVPPHAVEAHIRKARVLALPSFRGDGLPNAVLEAMSLGRPVVATGIAGIPEIVQHGRTGYIVKPGDVDQLAFALARLNRDEVLAQEMGRNARLVAEGYSWDRVIPALESILAEVRLNARDSQAAPLAGKSDASVGRMG